MDSIGYLYIFMAILPWIIFLTIRNPYIFPLGIYAFLVPFDAVLSITGSAQGPTLIKFIGILAIPVLLLKNTIENRLKPPNLANVWMFLFIFFGILSTFWALQTAPVFSRLPTAVGLFLLYFTIAIIKIEKKDFETIELLILMGGLFAAIYSIRSFLNGQFYLGDTSRATMLIGGGREADPNKFAFSLILPIAIAIQKAVEEENWLKKLFLWVALALMVFCIIVTGSRGASVGVAIVFIVNIIFGRGKLTLGMITLILGILLVFLIPDFLINRIPEAMETGGAGRLDIWSYGLLALKKFFFLGAGLNNFPEAYSEFSLGLPRAAHNIYLGVFVELGIIGFAFFTFSIISHLGLTFNSRTDSNIIILRAALIAALFSSFFSDTIWRKSFWLIFMLIAMHNNITEVIPEKEPITFDSYTHLPVSTKD